MAYNSWSVGSFALTGGRVNAGPQPGRSSIHTAQPSGTLQSCPHDSDSTYLPMVCKCYAKYPWASLVAQMVKKTRLQCRRPGFDPWVGKRLKGDCRDLGSIPGLGRSPGEGNGHLLHYFCLENSMDRGAWWSIQFMGLQSWARLSN